jgi:large subunit ribosomal protein L13
LPKADDRIIIDASNLILGRMASITAKRILNGETIVILNAEKTLVSGKKQSKIIELKESLRLGGPGNPKYGPIHYRRPDRILRNTVRGMLTSHRARGKEAYRRLRVYIGVPEEYKDKPRATLNDAAAKSRVSYTTLGELTKEIGWKPVGES